ncbi:amidase family protein [Ancylobacter amanitiformis]|uniref:amidase family protein n=1 Tax=Ancylobacter amanitiformis TaxID=217069 RepID=UPI0027D91F4A|nr:amidase family protein [Ancylobacter amanitiformis]
MFRNPCRSGSGHRASGSIFKRRVRDVDATAVARLKAAGGILLAKTNAPKFTYSIETDNLLTGHSIMLAALNSMRDRRSVSGRNESVR